MKNSLTKKNSVKKADLFPPDREQLKKVLQICTQENPYQDSHIAGLEFVLALKEVFSWHSDRSSFFKTFLQQNNFDIKTWDGSLDKIPFIAADFFKFHEVKSIEEDKVFLHLTSSGTTGQKSQIFFDQWSLESAQQMVKFIFHYYGWVTEEKTNYLLYSYQTEADSKLGTAYTDNFLTQFAPVNAIEYALKWNGKNGHDFDLYGCIRALQKFSDEGLPVRILGFPSFLYFTIQRMRDLQMKPLKLSPKSLVFLGGGWKGFADKAIDKTEFYKMVEDQLGIPNERLRDGFGSVEHCIPYIECKNHHFHVPVYSKVLIRDLYHLKNVGYNQEGFLQFISPYITSVPANSVLMGDLAILHKGSDCDCGLNTDWFEILGRAGLTKNKSCAIAAAELLRGFL